MNTHGTLSQLEYSLNPRHAFIGAQMFFVAFGALVLVPLLTGLDPSVALFTAGVGTLIFQISTKGQVPVFLASSFAFIAPIQYGISAFGLGGTLCGLTAAGLVYVVISFLVRVKGMDIIGRILPPVVTGPVIMVIGLSLAPVAVNMAIGKTGDGSAVLFARNDAMIVSMSALLATVCASVFGRGVLKLIPIFCGIIVGYAISWYFGFVHFAPVVAADWISMPPFSFPTWNLQAIFFIVPVAIAPIIEHVGNIVAIGSVTGGNYIKSPGLHRTLLGDGLASMLASMLGGPPNTTYSEVTGGIALTKAFNPGVMTWASISAIILAFVGKLGALLGTIPTPVMGGIMVLLFGTIVVVGMNSLVRGGDDLMEPRNMTIVAVVLVFGLGGMTFNAGEFILQGIGLAGITGLVLNLVLPGIRE